MGIDKKLIKEHLLKCKICSKEIPKSAAMSAEGVDYVWNFCGKECYDKWQNMQKQNDKNISKNKKSIQENPGEQNTG